MLPLQSSSVETAKLDAPETDRFSTDDNAAFSQEIFYVSMTQIESVVEPDCVANDVSPESMALVGIHSPILAISTS